jgi:hypothetical protein
MILMAWEMYKQLAGEVGGVQLWARNTSVTAFIIMSDHLPEQPQAWVVILDVST